ncbi:hypothetical protein DRL66_08005 [Salmonella enterica subsp. enterica serovar Muenchen]|nr:hypothetical protein [Salmonella enterica subsp. enterica serovar Muenchen]
MKKLIIAAGIAAATMASFGANADVTFSAPSYASINTTVKSDSYLAVTASDADTTLSGINKVGTVLGSFNVSIAGENAPVYSKIVVEKIHAHGYPASGFNIKLKGGSTECIVEAGTHPDALANNLGETNSIEGTCGFTVVEANDIQVTTAAGSVQVVEPGVKTITAQFRAYNS